MGKSTHAIGGCRKRTRAYDEGRGGQIFATLCVNTN